jgi:hypothetical protein
MTNQTDHERARIIEAHDTIAQEAYWGGEPDKDAETSDDALTVTYKWAMSKAEARGKGNGLMAAYDTLKDRISFEDRMLLLEMAARAFAGEDAGGVK